MKRGAKARALVATASITAVLIGPIMIGDSWAVEPSPVLNACAKKDNGQLRLVEMGEACHPSERPVQWGSQAVKMVAGIITPEGEIGFGSPFGGTDFTVGRLAQGVYQVDIAPAVFPGIRCPVTLAQSWFTDAHMKVSGWVCDPSGYHVSFVTSDGNDAGFWFAVIQIQ